jgi:hypothetical protein
MSNFGGGAFFFGFVYESVGISDGRFGGTGAWGRAGVGLGCGDGTLGPTGEFEGATSNLASLFRRI